MSELLASVRSSFFHDVLGFSDAEARLEGKEGAYLLRESDVKPSMFILSYVKSSAVSHILIPNKNGKYIRQSLEDAVEMTADIIAASDIFISFVPPPNSHPQDSSGSEAHDSEANKCYCCNFTSDNKRTLESHQKCHKLIKCAECSKYVKSGSFTSHKRYCTDTPEKLSCAVCGFETVQRSVMWAHRRNHIARPFLCREGDCRRVFKTEEELVIHQNVHLDKGYKCEHCGKVFKNRYDKGRHVHSMHLYAKRRCSVGWFNQVRQETVKKKAQGRTMLPCKVDGCTFKTRWSETERMARHVASKHPVSPKPKKPHECSCKKSFAFPYLLHKHQKKCKLVRANTKRVFKMVSNKSLVEIKKKYPGVTKSAFCGIFKEFSKQNPEIIFEGNFRQALDDSISELKKLFSAEHLNVQDSKGCELATVVILVKDLHYIIREYIRRFGIISPRICLGMDGGNFKFLVTLAILDMANLGPDICSFSRNGRRRSLIVAAVNRCKETKKNLTKVLDKLFLVKLEFPTVFPMDLLCANLFMGLGRHSSYCPCLYCEGYKLKEDMVTWTTDKALYWVQDAPRRTMKRIRELRAGWEAKWKGRKGGLNSKAAKDDIKNFASVIDWPIELPEAMQEKLILLVIPPDPLHVCLIGRFIN